MTLLLDTVNTLINASKQQTARTLAYTRMLTCINDLLIKCYLLTKAVIPTEAVSEILNTLFSHSFRILSWFLFNKWLHGVVVHLRFYLSHFRPGKELMIPGFVLIR